MNNELYKQEGLHSSSLLEKWERSLINSFCYLHVIPLYVTFEIQLSSLSPEVQSHFRSQLYMCLHLSWIGKSLPQKKRVRTETQRAA